MTDHITNRLDQLAAATIKLTEQVTILSEAVVDLRRLREQQHDLREQQVATDQRARIGLVHALDAADQVQSVEQRVGELQTEHRAVMNRNSTVTRVVLIVLTAVIAAYGALQLSHLAETSCPRDFTDSNLSKAACLVLLPSEPPSTPPPPPA